LPDAVVGTDVPMPSRRSVDGTLDNRKADLPYKSRVTE